MTIAAALCWGKNPCDLSETLSLDDANLRRALLTVEVFRGWRTFRDALTGAAKYDAQ